MPRTGILHPAGATFLHRSANSGDLCLEILHKTTLLQTQHFLNPLARSSFFAPNAFSGPLVDFVQPQFPLPG